MQMVYVLVQFYISVSSKFDIHYQIVIKYFYNLTNFTNDFDKHVFKTFIFRGRKIFCHHFGSLLFIFTYSISPLLNFSFDNEHTDAHKYRFVISTNHFRLSLNLHQT